MKNSPLLNHDLLKELGILDWGYTEESTPVSFHHFSEWVKESHHLPLHYLGDHRHDLRGDLKKVYPEFKSALVFLFSYQKTKKWMLENNEHRIASYALGFEGEDYHRVLKERLQIIFESLNIPDLDSFISLDAQPVLERDLAFRAGLGWFGKNSMLINKKEGSYFIIGSLLLNQTLPISQSPFDVDHCGNCNACVEACPTEAIDSDRRTLIAEKCISTFTIETFKDQESPKGFDKSRGEIFGCDICQDVCPWNKKPLERVVGELKLNESYLFLKEWFFVFPKEKLKTLFETFSNKEFKRKLFGTPFDRPGKKGWPKNLK